MKILKKLSMILPMLAVCFGFASCSSDDEPIRYSDEIAGNYEGYSEMSSTYFSNMMALDQKVTITKIDETTVSVSYNSASTGTYTITGAKVAIDGDKFTITGNGTTAMGHAGNIKDYDCSLVANIDKSGNSVFEFSVPSVMGGVKVVVYQGELPEAKYKYVVAGSYKGYFKGVAAYFPQGMVEESQSTITVTPNSDNTVNVKGESETWGTLTVNNVTVTRNGNIFSFDGEGTTEMGMNGNVSTYACNLEASKDASSDETSIKFTMPAVMGGLTLTLGEAANQD